MNGIIIGIIVAFGIAIIGAIFCFGIPILSKISNISGLLQGKGEKEILEKIEKVLKESVERIKGE